MKSDPVSGLQEKVVRPLSPMGRRVMWIVLAPFIAPAMSVLFLVALIVLQVARPFSIPTNAMSPTIVKDDQIYTSLASYLLDPPHRGDVVCFWSKGITELEQRTKGVNTTYVKRVVGLPGETIALHHGRLLINGTPAPGLAAIHYVPAPEGTSLTGDDESYVVPPDSYYVLGDNSAKSLDSRYWGCVPAANLRGRALFRFWPPGRMGLIN